MEFLNFNNFSSPSFGLGCYITATKNNSRVGKYYWRSDVNTLDKKRVYV